MPFPAIRYCLVCEATRAEPFGKMSLLGFYGLAPDVQIAVKDFAQPLQLAFVFVGNAVGAGGQYSVQFRLTEAAGAPVVAPPASPTDLAAGSGGQRLDFAIQLGQ